MHKYQIVLAIMRIVEVFGGEYSRWRIGITSNLPRRYREHAERGRNLLRNLVWQANSLEDARDIESFFINHMGMAGGTGGDIEEGKPVFVYIMPE